MNYASAFELSRSGCSKAKRIDYIKKLFSIYVKEYVHDVLDESKGSLVDDEYTISVRYPAKLQCSENELVNEFNSLWPLMTKAWLKFKDSALKSTTGKQFLIHIIEAFAIEYLNLFELIMVLLAISSGTGPLGRSFTKLAKICYKDRSSIASENLEVLYLLSALSINEDDDELYEKTRKVLQKKELVICVENI